MPQELNSVNVSLDFLSVCEAAAIAAARTMGQGDRKYSDHVAVEAMREKMDAVPMRGRIVIGEGERDEAPMLFIGEEVGEGYHDGVSPDDYPEVDIAVDPLEGTNLCALGANNAIAVLAASERGGLLNAPDIYMDKIVVGPSCRGVIDIDAPVKDNLKAIARRLSRDVEDLTVIVLDRSRHRQLIADVRAAGAPPMPISAWMFVPATAAEMPAERSPSPMRRMRAPAERTSAMSLRWRERSRTMTVKSSMSRLSLRAMALRLSLTAASMSMAPRHEGPTTILSM
jgi:hypothetical protein